MINIHDTNKPTVLKQKAIDWGLDLFFESLKEGLQETVISFRVGQLTNKKSRREYECISISATIADFFYWFEVSASDQLIEENPFSILPSPQSQRVFIYADYKHFSETFDTIPISWGQWNRVIADFPEGDRSDTFWMGTKGSHTPLHYDTYGCNIVAQIYGRKRWLLWNPSSIRTHTTISPPPLRVPYEESSVYSSYDPFPHLDQAILHPDCIPPDWDITLEPGDILFIPKHFWHFVISIDDLTVSVNQWIPLPSDPRDRFSESIVRFTASAFTTCLSRVGLPARDPKSGWISPSEVEDEEDEDEGVDESLVRSNAISDGKCADALRGVVESYAELVGVPPSDCAASVDGVVKDVLNRLLHPDTIELCLKDVFKQIV